MLNLFCTLFENKPRIRFLLPFHNNIPEGFKAEPHRRVVAIRHIKPRADPLVVGDWPFLPYAMLGIDLQVFIEIGQERRLC